MQAQPSSMLAERLKGIVGRMEAMAADRLAKRQSLEKRWVDDLLQYWGRYDADTEKKLNAGEASKIFINLTGPKTDAMSARLMDLLFPTDDRNWGIQPTPVPSLTANARQAAQSAIALAKKAKQVEEEAAANQEGVDPTKLAEAKSLQEQAVETARKADDLKRQLDEAKARAGLMETEIDDQLKESHYHAVMRDVIDQACKLGTGVAKGPVTGDKMRKGWEKKEAGYELAMSADDRPTMRWVDVWGFFPDMDASTIEASEGVLERHLMNTKKLRKLGGLKGFDKNAIRKLLSGKPSTAAPSYLADLRNITGDNQQIANDLYHVWEYTGPLSADDMRDLAMAMGDNQTVADVAEVDPLTEMNAIVWFCQGEVLKFAIYPYDSGECLYSVFCLKKDESSIFGYGIPALIRDPQRSLNAGWRAMMDNAGLASGPQIVIATDLIEPADGEWKIRPRKVWKAKAGLPQDRRAFATYDIPMKQVEMANIVALSQRFLDEMAAMPQIAQGEQGTGVTKTAQGMALLMNSANVGFRRIVKSFDDDMTTPSIRRFYDWNMQFNPRDEIKGDYSVDARGSSVLLVREMQAQNLMVIAIQLGAHPVYGPMLKQRGVLRKLFQAHMIPADDVMLTDEEIDAILASATAQSAEADAEAQRIDWEREKLSAEIELSNMDNDTKRYVADRNHEAQMMKLAETMNMSIDQIEANLTDKREERASKERSLAVEAAVATKTGQHAGGAV